MSSQQLTMIIFGASGDLTGRKLIPALFNSFRKGRLPEQFNIVGFARRDWGDDQFRQILYEGMMEFAPDAYEEEKWSAFCGRLHYFEGNLDVDEDFARLHTYLLDLEQSPANRIYYMATAPRFFVPIVENSP